MRGASQIVQYSNPPIYRVPRYNVPLCVPPISCFTIKHILTSPVLPCPRFTVPPIYRAFLLSPEKHGKSGDYCIILIRLLYPIAYKSEQVKLNGKKLIKWYLEYLDIKKVTYINILTLWQRKRFLNFQIVNFYF